MGISFEFDAVQPYVLTLLHIVMKIRESAPSTREKTRDQLRGKTVAVSHWRITARTM